MDECNFKISFAFNILILEWLLCPAGKPQTLFGNCLRKNYLKKYFKIVATQNIHTNNQVLWLLIDIYIYKKNGYYNLEHFS